MVSVHSGLDAKSNTTVATRVHLAPELLQGLKVLSMPVPSLIQYSISQAEHNPLLELDYESDFFKLEHLPFEQVNYLSHDATLISEELGSHAFATQKERSIASFFDEDFSRIRERYSETETLREHLRLQVPRLGLEERESQNINALIELISDDGYFDGTLSEFAAERGICEKDALELLKLIQTMDPLGVGARSLAECLALQVDSKGPHPDVLRDILLNHIEEFVANKVDFLAHLYGVTSRTILQMKQEVQSMNPYPGASFSQQWSCGYIVPDIVVRHGSFGVEATVVGSERPCLRLNNEYLSMLESNNLDNSTRLFLREKDQDAKMVLRSLDARKSMLQSFASYLLKKQYRYFITEGQQLDPMTMCEVANALDVNVSTISRAVQDKYLQTPWGSFPLKSFFSRAIERETIFGASKNISSFEIKNMIRSIVEEEPSDHPYSDAEITDLLNAQGIVIKRRTVTKYRAALGIKTQSSRKWIAMGAKASQLR